MLVLQTLQKKIGVEQKKSPWRQKMQVGLSNTQTCDECFLSCGEAH